ncbi:MAG: S8 family serine peptidase [Candidatus Kapabacteria bacterium]|nr:S8 family serine peptidase [Candidatus Kapabacteria bacterium]
MTAHTPLWSIQDDYLHRQALHCACQEEHAWRCVATGKAVAQGFYTPAILAPYKIQEPHTSVVYLKTKQCIITDKSRRSVSPSHVADAALRSMLLLWRIHRVQHLADLADGALSVLMLPTHATIDAVCSALESLSIVEYAEPMSIAEPRQSSAALPNDPLFPRQYYIQRIRAHEAWAQTQGSPTVLVAVCDTGIDWEHEDLADNIWINPGEDGRDALGRSKRNNGIDDDGNGKVDDWHGWDFVGAASEADLLNGRYREDNDPKPRFPTGLVPQELPNHGTVVAGIVAAIANNGRGGAGIAPRCKILPIKCSTDGARIDGIYRAYEAILYAAEMGAHVIVCSFGGGRYSRVEQDIIHAVTAQGALVVAAAGNHGLLTDNIDFPASYDNVLAVGASTMLDRASPTSDFGIMVDVFAPSEHIMSTASGNEYTESFSGTSVATPIVAAVAALVKSRFPRSSPEQITQQIRASSDNVLLGMLPPMQRPYGYFGRINAIRALTEDHPGLLLQNIQIGAAMGIIQDVQPVSIRCTLRNVLAHAQNVMVIFQSLDKRATILEPSYTVQQLRSGEQHEILLTVQLEPSALSGSGLRTADFVAVLLADGYINYQRISLPYNIREATQGAHILASAVLDFSLPQNGATLSTLDVSIRNAGAIAMQIDTLKVTGTHAAEFLVQRHGTLRLDRGQTTHIPVRFAPQAGAFGQRTATLTLTARPIGTLALGTIAAGYEFTTVREQYREFTDGILLQSATERIDDAEWIIPVGFAVRFGGRQYESVTLSSNGFCAFAPTSSLVQRGSVVTTPLSTSIPAAGYIAAFATDLVFPPHSSSSPLPSDIRWKTEGTAPERVFVVQWRNAALKLAPAVRINAQLRLYESSQRVEVWYGTCIFPTTQATVSGEVGLRGASSWDFHARRVSDDIQVSWSTSAEAVSNEDACELSSRNLPSSGLVYRWSPRDTPRQISLSAVTRTVMLRGTVVGMSPVVSAWASTDMASSSSWSITPNPAADEVWIDIPARMHNALVRILNVRGEVLVEETVPASIEPQQQRVSTRTVPSGLYLVCISAQGQRSVCRYLTIVR